MEDIKIVDNFLDENELKELTKIVKNMEWHYSHVSREKNYGPQSQFWYSDLKNNNFLNTHVFDKIKKHLPKEYTIDRLYANGQTKHLNGVYHQDDTRSTCYTCILYSNSEINNENWEKYGGCTEIYFNKFDIAQIKPIFNRLVIFKSNILHRGVGPDVNDFLRVTVAYKLLQSS